VARSRGYRSEFRQHHESFTFVCGERNVTRQAEHLEKHDGLLINIGEDELRAGAFDGVNHTEKNRDADTVDKICFAEIDYQGTAARLKLTPALTLDALAAQLVQVVARMNYCQLPVAS
jgi:hypothetical protein